MARDAFGNAQRSCLMAVISGSIAMNCGPVWAQAGADDTGGPAHRGGGLGGALGGGAHHGGHHVPGWREISQLPDLTPKQKTDIEAIYKQERQEIGPLFQQMHGGGPGGAGAGGGGGAGAGATGGGGGGGDVRAQIMAKRKETWEKVKPMLTEKQLGELKDMHGPGGPGGGPPGGGAPPE